MVIARARPNRTFVPENLEFDALRAHLSDPQARRKILIFRHFIG